MVTAAVGEEVSPDVINEYNTFDNAKLLQTRSAGISDQRVALIDAILAGRAAGDAPLAPTEQVAQQFPERGMATVTSRQVGGISYDPYIRDAAGNPIGTALPPPGSTPESIRQSFAQANKVLAEKTIEKLRQGQTQELGQPIELEEQEQQPEKISISQRLQALVRRKPREEQPITITPGGKQIVIPPQLREERGTAQSMLLGDEGYEEIFKQQTDIPTLETEEVGEVIADIQQEQEPTFTERTAQRISETGFGQTFLGQNLIKNLGLTVESIRRDAERYERERQTPVKDIFKTGDLPGAIRSGFFKFGTGTGQLLEQVGVKQPTAEKIGEVVGSASLGVFFLAPTAPTTTQIQREIAEVSRVTLRGVTQEGTRTIQTQAAFDVQRAGRSVRGIVIAQSRAMVQRDSKSLIVTAARGQRLKSVLDITPISTKPLGQVRTIVGKGFKSVEITGVKARGDLFFTRTKGITTAEGIYKGAGVSQRFKDFIIQAGVTRGKQPSFSLGVFKIRTTTPTTTFTTTTSGARTNLNQIIQTQSVVMKSIALEQTRSAVRASVSIPIQTPLSIIPIVPPLKTKTITKITQPSAQSVTQITSQATNQVTKQITGVTTGQIFSQRVTQKTRTLQQQLPRELQIQKTQQVTRQLSIQKQIPKLLTIQRTFQVMKQTQKFFPMVRVPTPRVSKGILGFFKPKLVKQITPSAERFPVLLRRFGIFRVVGFGRTPMHAFAIGRQAARRTLGATFKVPSIKSPLKVPGFKTKKTKEGILFIEQPRFRLDVPSEVKEIQMFRGLKGGRR